MVGCYEPEGDPLLEPDDGGAPDPDGGVPVCAPEPLPMLGQFLVEPVPEPVLPVLELDDGVVVEELDVEEFDVALEPELPEFPVVVEVVAALATSAPPATRPDDRAPMARTFRRRICMRLWPFVSCGTPTRCEPVSHTVRPGSGCSRTVT